MIVRLLAALGYALTLSACVREQPAPVNLDVVIGCWLIDAGHFSAATSTHVDPGQTALPPMLRLDTLPGQSSHGTQEGRRVDVFPANAWPDYRGGFHESFARDSLRIVWSNGFAGMSFDLRRDSLVMRGRATALTDYGGDERASVVLRRTTCPQPDSSQRPGKERWRR